MNILRVTDNSCVLLLLLFEFPFLPLLQQFELLSSSLLSSSRSILQIILVKIAVIKASIVYAIVATKNVKFPITNVAIRNAANIIAATKNGHLNIFCNAIDIIITAIGKAKKYK